MLQRHTTQLHLMTAFGGVLFWLVGCSNVYIDAVVRAGNTDTDSDGQSGTPTEATDQDSRLIDSLGRGVVAVDQPGIGVYVGWRLLAGDPPDISFNIYRDNRRINDTPVYSTTDFVDSEGTVDAFYVITSVIDGEEYEKTEAVPVLVSPYRRIPLSSTLSVYRAGVGDLDNDGEYDYVLIRPTATANTEPSSEQRQNTFKIEGHHRRGNLLWTIDLGWNVELGAPHNPQEGYDLDGDGVSEIIQSPMVVYDLDGDGIAEIIQKTAEGMIDGVGNRMEDIDDDGIDDYREADGRVISGPEYLSVFSGRTGEQLAWKAWIPREELWTWGSLEENTDASHEYLSELMSHNFMGIAYLDGKRPSIIIVRGIALRQEVWALDYIDQSLHIRWKWSSLNEGAD